MLGKLGARWTYGYIMGDGTSSNADHIFEEEAKKMNKESNKVANLQIPAQNGDKSLKES